MPFNPYRSVTVTDNVTSSTWGRGFLPLLAVMFLATPHLAFAQGSLAVTVDPRSLNVEEDDNTGAMYTVRLDAEPAGDVEITVVGGEDVINVDQRTLSFPAADWITTERTVKVTAPNDANAVDETVTLTHTATIGTGDDAEEATLRNVSVTVRVDDDDPRGVTVSALTPEEVPEAGRATYMIRLNTQPTAPVTVDIGGASGEITVSPSRLVFNPSGDVGLYSTDQPVTVFAGEDFDAENDTARLTHTVRGGDYTGEAAASVSVTVDDNDEHGVTVGPPSLDIAAGARGTFSIALNSQPTNTVRITVAENSDDLSVSPSRLSFSSSNWNRPQTVTVRVESDAQPTSGIILTNAIDMTSSSRDKSYDTEDPADVTVDISVPTSAVRLSRSSLTVDEGRTAEYTVRLASDPEGSVPASINSSNSAVTFTPLQNFNSDNWNEPQTVTVTAADDDNAVQETATLTHLVDGAIVANNILRVTVRESDTRGVTITPTSLEVTEGGTARYTIVLDSQPVGDAENRVTVTVGGVSGDVTVALSQRLFTHDNWFEAQEVEVIAASDDDGEPDAPVTLSHTVRGADYDRTRADNVRVTIKEIHTRGIDVDTTLGDDPNVLTTSLAIDEGKTGTYRVKLESQPTGTVTVMVRGMSGDVSVSPSSLIFTTSNWNEWKMLEVKAGKDDDAEADPAVTLTHVASGGGYSGVTSGTVTVTINELDEASVIVTPRALTVNEGAAASSYTVVLTTEPTGTVTITLGGLAEAKTQSLVVNPTALTFRRGNWNIPQAVTVRAAEDDDATGAQGADAITLRHQVNGGGYDDVNEALLNVSVTVIDDDSARIIVSTPSLQMAQGSRRTYTVVLGSKPTEDVSVAIGGEEPTDVSVTPDPLLFTQTNWATPRTVTVHAAAGQQPTTVTLRHTGTGYIEAIVSLTVKSRTEPGVAINPTSLEITEGGSDSYSVVLTSAPSATVYVEVSGASGDVRVSRTRLSFSTSNWDREQSVTVSVSEDDDAYPDAHVMLTHKVTGAEEYENAVPAVPISDVGVTPKENDKRGVTATPTSLTVAAGSSGTYRVGLTSEPLDAVTVTVNSPSEDVTVTGSPLVFTTANWDTDQTVTVKVAADTESKTEQSVTLTHTVEGGDYLGLEGPTVTVRIPVEGAPSAPTGLTAEGGDQSATLTWGAPANDGGSAILRYQVRYQETGGSYSAWATVSGGAGATSTTVSGLENGKSYEFQVRAVNAVAAGQMATASATLAEGAPGAPAGFTATGGAESVALSWSAPEDGGSQILRYEYRYAASGETWSDWATVSGGGSARSITITGLTNGTLYGFQVRAVNSIGEGEASQATATPGRAPSAPTGLAASVESESITVMWGMPADDGGSAIVRYEVNYRESGGQASGWMTVAGGASATSHTIMGLTNGIGYEIAVRAVNAIDPGPAASVTATPMEGIDFAHFANGQAGGVTITSDIVLVNVETSTVTPAIYFYNQMGEMIDADSVVDLMGGLEMAGDGSLTVPMGIVGRGEMTISTSGEGALVIGSVRVFGTGRLGGVLRFDIPFVGVAGVGASEPVNDAIFPARRMAGGINTGAAIRNLSAEDMTVTCMLMQGGAVMDTAMIELDGDGHSSRFIDEMFPGANTTDFVGSVRCTAPDGGMFAGVALELDAPSGIFTTLPVVPLNTGSDSGESMLNFAHFANGEFGGVATSSDLVFVNVATSAVAPAIYFYDQMGNMIDASMVVDAMMDGVEVGSDGALMVMDEIPPMGEMTISTSGMGDGMVGSVRVVSDGSIGGVLRFDIPTIGVAGVGASEAVNAAIFPARRMANGINTGAAIRNLESGAATVTCRLMADGQRMGEAAIELAGNGQNSQFINELFPSANTDDFEGSVHCTAPAGSMFTGVALEMDFNNRIFTTLPVVPVQ